MVLPGEELSGEKVLVGGAAWPSKVGIRVGEDSQKEAKKELSSIQNLP